MNRGLRAVLVYWLLLILGVNFIWSPFNEVKFEVPKGWPKPVYDFRANKLTAEGIELGKDLFYDPILSKDSSISCESCHLSFTAFTHADHKLSHGIGGAVGTRNAPSIVNMAWSNSFMWDGGVNNLEVQPINPITNPLEMGSDLKTVIKKLQRSSKYKRMFYKVYRDSVITSAKVLKSLALFTSNIVSYNSKYDSVTRHLKGVEFTEMEARGYILFKKNCASCHREPLFTDNSFRNNGLKVDTFLKDKGRMKITKNIADSLKFKVPTLRNIEFSAPYFHDGRVGKLRDVIEHYSSGIVQSSTLDPLLKNGVALNKDEKKDLIAFLKTLSDRYYLYNVAYRPNR